MSTFKDHFSAGSAAYASHRPTYPPALVDALADLAPGTALALDVGCGTGQLSVPLARRFGRVVAIDASPQQIAAAEPHERVEYRVAPAERSGLPDGSADLVTVAQAAHWLDLPVFYEEARRVARPGAVLALVTYGVIEAEPELRPAMERFYWQTIAPYWPQERRHVEEGYRSLPFPFREFSLPPLAIAVDWSLPDLLGYVGTWSAVEAAEKALPESPVIAFGRQMAALWGEPGRRRRMRFPLSVRAGRV